MKTFFLVFAILCLISLAASLKTGFTFNKASDLALEIGTKLQDRIVDKGMSVPEITECLVHLRDGTSTDESCKDVVMTEYDDIKKDINI